MATNFPTSLDSYADLTCASTDLPKDRVNNLQDAVEAVEDKVGITGDTDVNSHSYKLSGVIGADKAASLTGAETLTNKTLTSPKINENVALTSTSTELNFLDGSVEGTSVPSKALVLGASSNTNLLAIDLALKFNSPQGFMVNGQIVVSVASNNITVALKTAAGTDPSATDPVYVKIGNSVRTVAASLSVTKNAGTNWGNSGASILATKSVPWFTYLGWDSSNSLVRIGYSRIPYATTYSDFSTTTTDERYGAFDTAPGASDEVTVIGRFLATLSATAAFNWSITGTGSVVNRPIYESDRMDFVPTLTGWSGTPTVIAKYKVVGKSVLIEASASGTSNATSASMTVPWTNRNGVASFGIGYVVDNGADAVGLYSLQPNAATIGTNRINTGTASGASLQVGTFTNSGTKSIYPITSYEI